MLKVRLHGTIFSGRASSNPSREHNQEVVSRVISIGMSHWGLVPIERLLSLQFGGAGSSAPPESKPDVMCPPNSFKAIKNKMPRGGQEYWHPPLENASSKTESSLK